MIEPVMSAARELLKKAPWPQSCWMMNSRIMKKAAGIASASVSQYDTERLKYISTQVPTYMIAAVDSCQMLRVVSGLRYGASRAPQKGVTGACVGSGMGIADGPPVV